ncbi:TonB-dependent receptor plug domain-containing protein [Pedobacter sp. SL55]|uniref:TonB-dependent receptor plug domain-containing protein n=1 Tax=Pedobacter sp. SL55 TaxID=2995161 RepID=UPI003B63C255
MIRLILLFALISSCAFAQETHRGMIPSKATVYNSGPLYVVNGLVVEGGKAFFALLNPNDVEKIDILKDAASTAIYGIRGANGVVLITLKPKVKLLPYSKLIKKFKVKKQYRDYAVYVDKDAINSKTTFVSASSWIKEIIMLQRSSGIIDIPYLNIVPNK